MIDTLLLVIADQGSGKSNQIRSVFEEAELYSAYGGYPKSANIRRNYEVHPDVDLLVRLSSWHERGESYAQVKADLKAGHIDPKRRYKVIAPAQVSATSKLAAGEDLFIKLHTDFDIRRSYAVSCTRMLLADWPSGSPPTWLPFFQRPVPPAHWRSTAPLSTQAPRRRRTASMHGCSRTCCSGSDL